MRTRFFCSKIIVTVAAVAAVAALGSACGRGGSDGGKSESGVAGGGDPVAAMFLRNKDRLQAASEAIETSLSVDLAGFVTPLPGSGSNEVTLDFMVANKEGGPALVVAALVPYEVGDTVQGPGARFVPLENPAFVLTPGERKPVSVKVIRERVMPSATPTAGAISPPAAGFRPAQAAPTPLFDPRLGVKVLVVVQEESVVDANVVSRVRAVSDSDFEREYGKFLRREIAIPVPPQQIL